jgi:urea transport system permease protein
MITQRLFAGGFDRRIVIAILMLVAIAILVPVLHLAVPPSSAFHVPNYVVTLVGKYLTYALLALALDLVWGYCGILSLGHAAFFALGGYAMGMYLMRQIGDRGVYGNPILPDFMVFLNWQELPWFWYGFDQFWFAALMIVAVPGLLAFVFGWFAFRSRVTGVYLSIITQALTYALLLAFFRNDMGFGGNNGLTDFKDILGFNVQAPETRAALFSASALALALGLLVTSAITRSKFGKLMIAVRDAESRTRFIGWRPENVKLFAFTVSAVMAGIAGALYVPQVGIINPGEFAPANSIEVVVWTAVGGRGTLVGPVIGALLVNGGKSWFTGVLPEFWLFALGGLFVAVTLFLPKGIVGTYDAWRAARRDEAERKKTMADEAAAPPPVDPATGRPAGAAAVAKPAADLPGGAAQPAE